MFTHSLDLSFSPLVTILTWLRAVIIVPIIIVVVAPAAKFSGGIFDLLGHFTCDAFLKLDNSIAKLLTCVNLFFSKLGKGLVCAQKC